MTFTRHQNLTIASQVDVIDDFPFKLSADPRFFYHSRSAQAIYDSLLTGVRDHQGAMLLVGEPGTGKTTLLLMLKEALEASNCLVVFPRRPVLSFDELIQPCCEATGVAQGLMDRMDKVQAFTNVLFERADDGATAIFIDNAQALSDESLADLSRLTKIKKGDANLLQVILAGQPELVTRLSASDLPFAQECAIACRRLDRLDTREVGEYIAFRLARVGYKAQPFAPKSIRHIAEFSHGIPQVINQLCGMSLVGADMEDAEAVSAEIVDRTALALLGAPSQLTASAEPPEAITPVFSREAGRSLVEEAAEVETFDLGGEQEDQASKGFTDRAAETETMAEADVAAEAGTDHPSLDPVFQRLAIDWPSVEADLTGGEGAQEKPDPSFPAGLDLKRGSPATIAGIFLIGLVVGAAAMALLEFTGGGGSPEQIAVTRASAADEGSELAKVPEQDNGSGEVETALAVSAEVPQPAELSTPQPSDETQTASSGGSREFFLQLASLRSADNAQRERERLATLHGDLLSEFELSIQEIDVSGLAYYQVRSAPFTGRDKAYDTCAQLEARAQGCLVRQQGNGIENTSPTVKETGAIVATAVVEGGSASGSTALALLGGLAVRDFVLSRGVEEREPVGLTETFSAADREGYAYTRLRNLGPPKHVAFVWRHQDTVISRFETTVGTSVHWRTWSNAELRPGKWLVQLVSEDGDVLAEVAFMVE